MAVVLFLFLVVVWLCGVFGVGGWRRLEIRIASSTIATLVVEGGARDETRLAAGWIDRSEMNER